MQLFYSQNIKNDIIILNKIESNHCIKVLRYTKGDLINVTDGCGNLYNGEIIDVLKHECHVLIKNTKKEYSKKDYRVHIAISPIKNQDRIEWFIEKAVEIGIDEISFIKCNRSISKSINIKR